MCAAIAGRNGPVGAHPRQGGGTARTLAGSVRWYEIHYTGNDEVAYLPRNQAAARYNWCLAPLS